MEARWWKNPFEILHAWCFILVWKLQKLANTCLHQFQVNMESYYRSATKAYI